MSDALLDGQVAIRDDLCASLRESLMGPSDPAETLEEPPLDRYVMGILYPRLDQGRGQRIEPAAEGEVQDDGGDGAADPAVALSNVQYPSSAGITFATDPAVEAVFVTVDLARYVEDDGRWRRTPIRREAIRVDVDKTGKGEQEVADGLMLYWRSREVLKDARSVTVVLMNELEGESGKKDATSFFQTSFSVEGVEGGGPPFVATPERVDTSDEDLKTNALLYRDRPEFAIGHGCSADWRQVPGTRTADLVCATFLPTKELEIMESNPEIPDERLGFDELSRASRHDLVANLEAFVAGYSKWISEREREVLLLEKSFAETAELHLRDCQEARDRILVGIETVRDDDGAFRAFQLANAAMADQMERGSDTPRDKFRWRPFQLAFVLLSIPSIVDPSRSERSIAELLWFPTGGGKTEAYLGLFAFTVFHRRISRGGAAGVTAIMRYTLRLLTAQQFERAATVVCACDRIRDAEGDLGEEPISVGLFVGAESTPNTLTEARESRNRLRAGHRVPTRNPVQLHVCPWCEVPLDHMNYVMREDPDRMQIECRNDSCHFAEGLPVHVVDEDIYRVRPSLVIGTVDKFAALPWRPIIGNLFNLNEPTEPPPELVIQDELHLISGPLGTMTGLYEAAVDILGTDGEGAPPKVVASTATIRRAKAQSKGLFAREMRQFPPPGLDPGNSWFATVAPPSETGPRRYVGLMAAGVSHATLLIRAYAALLHRAGTHVPGPVLDPYWTLVGYFNSLRVLGAARMQVQDDVQDWLGIAAGNGEPRRVGEPAELTSRVDSAEIPGRLKEMERELPDEHVLDVVLATNMISVGVDVDRLGLMVMMGQPQAAAEYIQATSRVGRKHPGLVVTLLNAARSRDRSHYEGFVGFHNALYRSVEASSVTPFSPRARDRGLHAVLVALARLSVEGLRENDQAGAAPDHRVDLERIADRILERAQVVDPDETAGTAEDLRQVIDRWTVLAEERPGLRYESRGGEEPALLTTAAPDLEKAAFPTMWSLRNVDAVSNLFFARRS